VGASLAVARWGARCNAAELMGGRDEIGCGQPGRSEAGSVAEIQSRIVKGEAADGGPKVQRIAVGAAGEAVVDLPAEMDGEGAG
jgi:hypothetical protein